MTTARDERISKSEGIVLRHADVGEADRLITLFTPYRGKLRLVAKGARRPGSKLAGHLEPFTHTSVLIARGRNLDLITQAQTVRSFIEIRESLRRFVYASYAVELVDRGVEWDSEHRNLFDLLHSMLSQLSAAQRADSLLKAFELAALDVLGYRPRLNACVSCGRTLKPEGNGFSAEAGGVLCPLCRGREGDQRDITPATLATLRRLQSSGLQAADRVVMTTSVRIEAEAILAEYMRRRLEFDLNSAHVLHVLRQQMAALTL